MVGTEEAISRENPYSWYAAHPQFTRDAGTLAFGVPVGENIYLGSSRDAVNAAGIMRLEFTPTIGYSKDLNSPVNRAALQFFTYLRSVQKAASKYDVADVMMYFMAVDSMYMLHSTLKRAYKTAQLYTPLNKYYPRRLLQMQNVDPSIANNLAEFRAVINRFGLSLSRFPIPTDFDITNRHVWMTEGLYLDSNTSRAQTYMFVPHIFWKFNNQVETGSQLDPVNWSDYRGQGLHTLNEIEEMIDTLVNALINDQDTGMIAGDIYAAYGSGRLRTVEEVSDLAAILPVYSQEVLSQIENCSIMGTFAEDKPYITQNPGINNGAIIFTPTMNKASSPATGVYLNPMFDYNGRVLNMHVDAPTPEMVIEATRLCATTSQAVNYSSAVYQPTTFGADIINEITIGVLNTETGALSQLRSSTQVFDYDATVNTISIPNLQMMCYLQQFDWAPIFLLEAYTPGVSGGNVTQIAGDIDNMTFVHDTQLRMMHEAAMYSLFNVPQVGTRT